MTALIASGTILVIILATDLGRRKVTPVRMLRAVVAVAVVIVLFVHSFPTSGNDLSLQTIGVGVGVICGLVAAVFLPAFRERNGDVYTVGGVPYALVWIVLAGGRVAFAYGAEHWFPEGLIRFSVRYELSGQDVYANTFVFMALATVLTRTAVLMVKARRLRAAGTGDSAPAETGQPFGGGVR
ncbi:hypothetical protein ABZ707_31190 [Streptomyces sp. NPDC006923]|uniref:hypothetical protein n=1 Tax=Streptomyces sp. NPDC006923 TaxID=3155355 RepID=UPI0033DEA5FB